VAGPLTPELLQETIEKVSVGEHARRVLWDGHEADLSPIHGLHIDRMASWSLPLAEKRRGGRSAIVVEGDLNFGVARMMQSYAESREFPFEVRCFRDREEALKWLMEPLD
jgi:hypothetical protein